MTNPLDACRKVLEWWDQGPITVRDSVAWDQSSGKYVRPPEPTFVTEARAAVQYADAHPYDDALGGRTVAGERVDTEQTAV